MKLFNTLTQSLETFTPASDTVRIYVCGVTPYDTTHVGHAFVYVSFDVLMRYLRYQGYKVKYVQNLTDVDNSILRRARQIDVPWDVLGQRESERFLNDLRDLHVIPPDVYPRATEEIPSMLEMIKILLTKGYAYERDGWVYYRVSKDPEFGRLAAATGLKTPASRLMIANSRGNDPNDPRKHDPLDFVLWQAQAPGEPAWESPWGPGRPGWHIECSAMATRYLGEQIDIHGGGGDLIFPHHSCEIAQSEHVSDKNPFCRYWMHVGMVYQDGEKMSKSLGNMTMVSRLLKEYDADTIRLALLSHQYRFPWEWFPQDLATATVLADQLRQVRALVNASGRSGEDFILRDRFLAALDNDLNTTEALLLLREAARKVLLDQNYALGNEVVRLTDLLGLTLL